MAKKKINADKFYKAIDFKPHPYQAAVLDAIDNNREVLVRAGRRSGKSECCAVAVCKVLMERNKEVWLVAPTYDLSSIVFDKVVGYMGRILKGGKDFRISKKPPQTLYVESTGSKLVLRSADSPSGMLGRSTDMIVMDEAARIKENIWQLYLYPTTNERKGKLVYISTPEWRNWFYDKDVELAKSSASFHFVSKDNPHFPESEWEKTKEKLPAKIFAQQYMAQYLSLADAVFGEIDSIVSPNCLSEPVANHHYVMGVDFGRRTDATSVVVLDRTNHNVVLLENWKKCEWSVQKEKIQAIAKKYNNATVWAESTGVGDPLVGDLFRAGVFVQEFRTAAHNKASLIEKLIIFIEQKLITIPDDPVLIEQLQGFEKTVTEHGNVKYAAPGRRHDDTVMALALGVQGLTEPWGEPKEKRKPIYARSQKANEYL